MFKTWAKFSFPSSPSEWLGKRVRIKWSEDEYYDCIVRRYNCVTKTFFVVYDDGEASWESLTPDVCTLLSDKIPVHMKCVTAVSSNKPCWICKGEQPWVTDIPLHCVRCQRACHSRCFMLSTSKNTEHNITQRDVRCPSCRTCEHCKGTVTCSSFLTCSVCYIMVHPTCESPKITTVTDANAWICSQCVVCRGCGSRHPGESIVDDEPPPWQYGCTLCRACARQMRNGKYCCVCMDVADINGNFKLRRAYKKCYYCNRLVHLECISSDADEKKDSAQNLKANKYKTPFECNWCTLRKQSVLMTDLLAELYRFFVITILHRC